MSCRQNLELSKWFEVAAFQGIQHRSCNQLTLLLVLKFNSKTSGENVDGSSVLVVSGISRQLIVERKVDAFEKFAIVICLDNVFRTVMRQFPVADQNSEPAIVKESSLRVAEAIQHLSQTYCVIWTIPTSPFE